MLRGSALFDSRMASTTMCGGGRAPVSSARPRLKASINSSSTSWPLNSASRLPHFGDVLVVTPALFSTLLEHRGAARRPARPAHWRSAGSRCTHAWPRRSRTHRSSRTWPTRPGGSIARWSTRRGCGEIRLHLAPAAADTTRSSAAARRTAPLAPKLVAAVLAPGRASPSVTVERPFGSRSSASRYRSTDFTAGAGGAAAGRGLDHHERGFVFLRNLRRRKPRLLQRGVLAEQRFLQRPSHTLSLLTFKFLAPPARPSIAAATLLDHLRIGLMPPRMATLLIMDPRGAQSRLRWHAQQSNRTRKHVTTAAYSAVSAVPTRFELAISSLTGTHVGPLHHGTGCN